MFDHPLARLYPEIGAGGFSRVDGTIAFYLRVKALRSELPGAAVVLDYGAGRGGFLDDPVPFRRNLRLLQNEATLVIGVDVDDAVMANPSIDEAHVIRIGEPLPLAEASVDLVVADWVMEHVTDPAWTAAELSRVLRPGGWLCVRTPNRRGYIALGTRLVPNRLRLSLLRRLQPNRSPKDAFPTAYLLNTPRALRRWFPPDRYRHLIYAADSEPAYLGGSVVAARLGRILSALTPRPFRSVLYAFLERR
jgi:SAM-dependent methyltransferase